MGILNEEYFREKQPFALSDGYAAEFVNYEKVENNRRYSGSRFTVSKDGKTIFTLDMPINGGRLICPDIIKHQNGNQYLLFCTELYGYSVLRLPSAEVYHYIPSGSINAEKESFIWCDAAYCPKNNSLYVSGCYRAYPYSVLIVDFSHPEALPFREFDLSNKAADRGGDIDPVGWESNGTLIYKKKNRIFINAATKYSLSVKADFVSYFVVKPCIPYRKAAVFRLVCRKISSLQLFASYDCLSQ